METQRILVTGANGFIGRHVCALLLAQGHTVRAAVRKQVDIGGVEIVIVGDINGQTAWSTALAGIDIVIHLAARVHVLRERDANPLELFREVNLRGTVHLAEAAKTAGVRRLVFVSTIGVHGDETAIDAPFTEASPPAPRTPYAISKWEAEQALHAITGLEVVIVRPPLVYGRGAPGNFRRITRLVEVNVPLPFGHVNNRRSMIAVQNLADFLVCAAIHPKAAKESFVISDGEDMSTTMLLRRLSQALGRSTLLVTVPSSLLATLFSIVGKKKMATQLLASLVIDPQKAATRLGWQPPYSVEAAFALLKDK